MMGVAMIVVCRSLTPLRTARLHSCSMAVIRVRAQMTHEDGRAYPQFMACSKNNRVDHYTLNCRYRAVPALGLARYFRKKVFQNI